MRNFSRRDLSSKRYRLDPRIYCCRRCFPRSSRPHSPESVDHGNNRECHIVFGRLASGYRKPALVAALPSSIALLRGLLPAPMAILIPYIILSNIILVAVFYTARKLNLETRFPSLIFAVSSAALLKFAFLFAVTSYFLKVAWPLLAMMHWRQLFTALAGGLIAIV